MERTSELRRRPPAATPVPFSLPSETTEGRHFSFVVPVVLAISVAGHAGALALAMLVPVSSSIGPVMDEVAIDVVSEPEPEPELEPPPPIEPAVQPVAAAPRVLRERPRPAAALPILTTEQAGGAAWAADPGDPDGVAGGQTGGEGAGIAAEPAPVIAPEPAIDREALRAMLLGYIRGTLGGYLHDRIDYPLVARREHLQGVVMLRIRLARDGRILAVRLSRSSGHEVLDRAALASVEGLGAMPAPPRTIPWDDEQELPLPVNYVLQ